MLKLFPFEKRLFDHFLNSTNLFSQKLIFRLDFISPFQLHLHFFQLFLPFFERLEDFLQLLSHRNDFEFVSVEFLH